MLDMRRPLRKNRYIEEKSVENKKILFNLDDGVVLRINDASALIWEMIDGVRSGTDLARAMTERFDVDFDTACQDARGVLEALFKDEFIDYAQ